MLEEMEITDRELKILKQLAEGKRASEIARDLHVNEQTVKSDILILKRLLVGIKATKEQLIYEACKHKLIG